MSLHLELDEGVTWHLSPNYSVVAWQPCPTVSVPLPDYGRPGRVRAWTTRQLEEVGSVPPGTARKYSPRRRRKLKGWL